LNHAEDLAPLYDPANQRRGGERVQAIRRFAVEAERFKSAARAYRERMATIDADSAQRALEAATGPAGPAADPG
jgi:hypothetical protein